MDIIKITECSENVLEAVNDLLPQLSPSALPLTAKQMTEIICSPSSHLLMAVEDGQFCGSLTLVIFKIPTGTRAWIEDVVVKESARGKGIGKLLTVKAVGLARELGAKAIDLTSNPSREAANALYKKVGLEQKETNVYRYRIA